MILVLCQRLGWAWHILRAALQLHGTGRGYLIHHGKESLFNVSAVLRACLKVWDAKGNGKLLGGPFVNGPFRHHVALVSNQKDAGVLGRVPMNFVQPMLDRFERFGTVRVINHNNAISPAVMCRCDCTKPFLASCVPHLQLDNLIVRLARSKRTDLEIHCAQGLASNIRGRCGI